MSTCIISCNKLSIQTVPTTTGIYIFCAKKKPTYIGKSINLRARLKSHFENAKIDAKERSIIESSDTIEYIVTDSEFKALLLESRWIQKYRPRYNVRWRDDKSFLYIKITINDKYPKVLITRREDDHKSLYFGPFSSVNIVRTVLKEIRRVFPFCTQKKSGAKRCFYAKINLCNPCPSEIEKLKTSKKLKATRQYRKNIRSLIKVLEGQTEYILKELYKKIYVLKQKQNYEEAIQIRERIARLEGIVMRKKFDEDSLDQYNQSTKQIHALQTLLKTYLPVQNLHRIECYDMSTLFFQHSTASMIVFTEGLSDKKEYKRFKIKEPVQSDFQMFEEVLTRRFTNTWEQPNLIVIDGGKPQVRTVQKVFLKQKITIPLIGIAKHPDRIILGDDSLITIKPQRHHPGFRLTQELRDESHRFAKKYHMYLRGKNMLK